MDAAATARARGLIDKELQARIDASIALESLGVGETAKPMSAAKIRERIRYSQPMAPGDYMIFPDQQLQRNASDLEAGWQYPFRRSDLVDRGVPAEKALSVARPGGKPVDLRGLNLTVGEAIRLGLIP